MRIDEFDFENTARAVYIMNPIYKSWKHIYNGMVSMAYQYCHESNSFSTGGYVLTAYNSHDGERRVRASVSGYLALQYALKHEKEVQEN